MKKLIAILAAAVLLLAAAVPFASAEGNNLGLGTMFVYTENGKSLNVRSAPETGDNIIGSLPYGAEVRVTGFEGAWAPHRLPQQPGFHLRQLIFVRSVQEAVPRTFFALPNLVQFRWNRTGTTLNFKVN